MQKKTFRQGVPFGKRCRRSSSIRTHLSVATIGLAYLQNRHILSLKSKQSSATKSSLYVVGIYSAWRASGRASIRYRSKARFCSESENAGVGSWASGTFSSVGLVSGEEPVKPWRRFGVAMRSESPVRVAKLDRANIRTDSRSACATPYNMPIKLSVRPVTHLACASCAPARPAAYRRR